MRDREYEPQVARVQKYLDLWHQRLGLGRWRITYEYFDEKAEQDAARRPSMMETEVRWQYLDARIKVYVPSIADVDDATLERIVIHEFMHLYLNELRPLGDWEDPREHALMHERLAHEEHAASSLADAFRWFRDVMEGERDEKPAETPQADMGASVTTSWSDLGWPDDRPKVPDQGSSVAGYASSETARLRSELATAHRQIDFIVRHLRDHHKLKGCIYGRAMGMGDSGCPYIQDVLDGDIEEESHA